MGFVNFIKELVGIEPKPDYAKVEPGNPDAFWLLDREISQAERMGPAALQVVWQRYGIRSAAHCERVKSWLYIAVKNHPEFHAAATRAQRPS